MADRDPVLVETVSAEPLDRHVVLGSGLVRTAGRASARTAAADDRGDPPVDDLTATRDNPCNKAPGVALFYYILSVVYDPCALGWRLVH